VWLPIVGRALAFICLHSDPVKDGGMAEKAKLLEALGLPRKETASLLQTTEDSIRGFLRYEKKSKIKKAKKNKSSIEEET